MRCERGLRSSGPARPCPGLPLVPGRLASCLRPRDFLSSPLSFRQPGLRSFGLAGHHSLGVSQDRARWECHGAVPVPGPRGRRSKTPSRDRALGSCEAVTATALKHGQEADDTSSVHARTPRENATQSSQCDRLKPPPKNKLEKRKTRPRWRSQQQHLQRLRGARRHLVQSERYVGHTGMSLIIIITTSFFLPLYPLYKLGTEVNTSHAWVPSSLSWLVIKKINWKHTSRVRKMLMPFDSVITLLGSYAKKKPKSRGCPLQCRL